MMRLYLVLALSGPALAGPSVRHDDFVLEPVEYEKQLVELCFPSGLRVAVQNEDRARVVSFTTIVDVGSASNPPGKEGLAHLVEHLWFRSAGPEYQRGGVHNGATGAEVTSYTLGVGLDQLGPALALEARRLEDPLRDLTEADLELEKRVVQAELNWRGEDTARVAVGRMYRRLYPEDHPYHRVSGGTRESVAAIDMEDVRAFVARHYLPERTTLLVVGDVTPEQVKEAMDEAFSADTLYAEGRACVARVDPMVPPPPDPPDPGFEVIEAPVVRPTLWLGWTLPGAWREDTELELAAGFLELAVLSGLSRVDHHRDDRFSIGCSFKPDVESSTALCALRLPWDVDGEEAAHKAMKGVDDLWRAETNTSRRWLLRRVAHRYRASLVRSTEEQLLPGSHISDCTARAYHYTGDPRWLQRRVAGLDDLSTEAVAELARTWLTRSRAVALLVKPATRQAESWEGPAMSRAQADPPLEGVVDVEAVTGGLDLSQAVGTTLDNGLDVVVLPFGEAPIVRAALVLGGGSATAGQGVELLVDRQTTYGTKGLPVGFSSGAAAIGGGMGWWNRPTWSADLVSASSGNLEAALALLRRLGNPPKYKRVKRSQLVDAEVARLRRLYDSPWGWATRVRGDGLWPADHHLGVHTSEAWLRRGFDVPEGVVRKELRRRHQPGNATLYVLGRIDDPAEALDLAREHFGRWKGTGHEPVPEVAPVTWERSRQVHFLEHPAALTSIQLECLVSCPEAREAGDVLADYLDLALYRELRTERGASYAQDAELKRYKGGLGLLSLWASVENDTAGASAATVLSLLERLGADGPEAEQLEASRLRVARGTSLELLTTGQVMYALVDADWNGRGRDSLPRRGASLVEVSASDLQALAGACVGREVMTVVGPAEIAGQLEEAGVDFVRRDWRGEVRALLEEYDPEWLKRREAE